MPATILTVLPTDLQERVIAAASQGCASRKVTAMTTPFGSSITINGSLNDAVAAAPTDPNFLARRTRQLPVPWNPDRYEAVIKRLLGDLHLSGVGGAVLARLKLRLTIRPYIWTPANALARPQSGPDSLEENALGGIGTGKGSPATIWITPANRRFPDATLLHEMVHAMQMMEGSNTLDEYGNNFDREGEYHAILVTNIFMSELGRKFIRLDHRPDSWVAQSKPWDQFRVDPFIITTFSMRHSTLALDIGRVKKAMFNPFSPKSSTYMNTR